MKHFVEIMSFRFIPKISFTIKVYLKQNTIEYMIFFVFIVF